MEATRKECEGNGGQGVQRSGQAGSRARRRRRAGKATEATEGESPVRATVREQGRQGLISGARATTAGSAAGWRQSRGADDERS
jgi:hypothetical protein